MKKFENALNNDKCYIYNRKNVTLREATIIISSPTHITVQDGYKINSYNYYRGDSIIGGEPGEVILSSRSTMDWQAVQDYGINKADLETALYEFRVGKRQAEAPIQEVPELQTSTTPTPGKSLDEVLGEAITALQTARESLKINEGSFKERLKAKIKDFIDKI